jgi:hypothetical protein
MKMSLLTKGVASFLGLTDTPASYVGQAEKLAKVNAGENGLKLDLLLSFTNWFNGATDTPVSFPWEFEAPFPRSLDPYHQLFYSPILRNAIGQAYCYMISFYHDSFYRYNIDTKQYTKLANLNYSPGSNTYRPIAVSPDGSRLCVSSAAIGRLEIYDIGANSWAASSVAPQISGNDALIQPYVWEDDDIIWCQVRAYVSGTWTVKVYKFTVSTDAWTSFASSATPSTHNGACMGISADKSTLYVGQCGPNYYSYLRYTIATDSYSFSNVGTQRYFLYSADRRKLWYTFVGDYAFHYLDCDDNTQHINAFPADPERTKGSNWGFGVEDIKSAIFLARTDPPRTMTYFGTGSWKLTERSISDYTLVVFEKPSDAFGIAVSNVSAGYFFQVYTFDTLTLPPGTWAFYYPKDGDYSGVKITAGPLK